MTAVSIKDDSGCLSLIIESD